MPLVKTTLEIEIRKITDEEFVQHEGFPATVADAAIRWANAIAIYTSSIVPATLNTELAKAAFITVMQAASAPGAALVAFPAAFTAYAAQVGLGMQPTFTAIPPPTPIILAPAFAIGNAGGSAADVAKVMSDIIDLWFRTGSAINNSSGVPTLWL